MNTQELTPACPACESNAVAEHANSYYCLSCPWVLNPHEPQAMGYPSPDENTDMLDGEYFFPDDIETAKEVH